MNDAMAIGAQYRKVFNSSLGAVLNIRQRQQMVNLAVVLRGAAVSATERESADLTVKRHRILLLIAHDRLIPFALKVQDQTTTTFSSIYRVNVDVESGR